MLLENYSAIPTYLTAILLLDYFATIFSLKIHKFNKKLY